MGTKIFQFIWWMKLSTQEQVQVWAILTEVFIIVETEQVDRHTWGLLKSGKGWITLGYTEEVGQNKEMRKT